MVKWKEWKCSTRNGSHSLLFYITYIHKKLPPQLHVLWIGLFNDMVYIIRIYKNRVSLYVCVDFSLFFYSGERFFYLLSVCSLRVSGEAFSEGIRELLTEKREAWCCLYVSVYYARWWNDMIWVNKIIHNSFSSIFHEHIHKFPRRRKKYLEILGRWSIPWWGSGLVCMWIYYYGEWTLGTLS